MTTASETYRVTVALEYRHPEQNYKLQTPLWVARDERGEWRSYCGSHLTHQAGQAVHLMFHADEIAGVDCDGSTARADLLA